MEKDNPVLSALITSLMKEKKPIWRRAARELSRARKNRIEVNLSKVQAYASDGATVLVPGKVLGAGYLERKVTVAAFSFSGSARKLIASAGGKALTIDALLKSNPGGRGVVILT